MRAGSFSCLVAAALVLSACGGGGSSNSGPRQIAFSQITGVGTTTNFGFDIGAVSGSHYFVTDRTNAAVDEFDTGSGALVAQIKSTGPNAFAGSGLTGGKVDNSISGPNGINPVGSLLYVGDVNSVKIIDPATQQVVKTITVGSTGKRADEGCVDTAHNLFMINTPEAPVPFSTFINTVTQAVVATVTYTDPAGAPSAGLEACRYDPTTDTFYVNNDGTTASPHGEFDALPGASIRAIPAGGTVNYTALAGVRMSDEGNCDPTGLALGPGTDVAVGCREGTTGAPLLVQIINRATGAIVASLNAGGGDQIEYDPATNRYYNAASRWTASGKASTDGGCSATSPCTPVLAIIDAAARSVVTMLPSGNNAHSVAVDAATHKAFVPISSGTSPAGCVTCNPGDSGGLLIFATQ